MLLTIRFPVWVDFVLEIWEFGEYFPCMDCPERHPTWYCDSLLLGFFLLGSSFPHCFVVLGTSFWKFFCRLLFNCSSSSSYSTLFWGLQLQFLPIQQISLWIVFLHSVLEFPAAFHSCFPLTFGFVFPFCGFGPPMTSASGPTSHVQTEEACDGSFESWLLWLFSPCLPSPCLFFYVFLNLCFSFSDSLPKWHKISA